MASGLFRDELGPVPLLTRGSKDGVGLGNAFPELYFLAAYYDRHLRLERPQFIFGDVREAVARYRLEKHPAGVVFCPAEEVHDRALASSSCICTTQPQVAGEDTEPKEGSKPSPWINVVDVGAALGQRRAEAKDSRPISEFLLQVRVPGPRRRPRRLR